MLENSAKPGAYDSPLLRALDLNPPVTPLALPGAIELSAARNEWVSFSVEIGEDAAAQTPSARSLRLTSPTMAASANLSALALPADVFTAWQIVAMPVDLNRASYVRHTGVTSDVAAQPRALLPLKSKDGTIALSQLRLTKPAGAAQVWFDLHIPPGTPAGQYTSRCDLLDSHNAAVASVDLHLTVYDFSLPDEHHLQLLSPLDWTRLAALYPERFAGLRPTQLNRTEPRYASAVRTLDQLITLAHENRCQAFVPRLGPVVKWPVGQLPDVDWEDFIGLVSPWMKGDAFADGQPLGFWPIPQPEFLARYARQSQLDYYQNAANRFDQNEWLPRSAIMIDPLHPGRASGADSLELSLLAADLLNDQARVRVALPLEIDQLQLASAARPTMIEPLKAGRLLCSAPNLIFSPPIQLWPEATPRPRRWLRTDLPGLLPYASAGGDERDVRLFAWLAYLRQADLVMFSGSLPGTPDAATSADPDDLTWFYPGEWFGLDQPVPTLQLKWLRRAEQDCEYLLLAKSRGDVIGPLLTARAITKPVQILGMESPDPVFSLMTGTVDPAAWRTVKDLLARRILLHQPGQVVDPRNERLIDMQSLHWLEPQDLQYQLARTVQFITDPAMPNEVGVRVGVDLYNASDDTPAANSINWSSVPDPWIFSPYGQAIPSLGLFQVNRATLPARVKLNRLGTGPAGTTPKPVEWSFTNGYSHKTYAMQAVIPVAPVDRRTTPMQINGSLEEWNSADAIQSGPMVKMLARPALQRQQLEPATNPTRLYAAWADDNFYVGFRLQGVTRTDILTTQNFVNYQDRRAWGEDLCELLIQPQYADNSLGPVLHVVCKPTGQWVERKLDRRFNADPWQPIEGLAIRYAATVDGGVWRGELAIPWKALLDPKLPRPSLLRFNAVHHVGATGESASWAGPIDFGRDESFMGLLVLRDLDAPNAAPSQPTNLTQDGR